eukprot:TRINITY_DN1626_c0_g1_i3.p1 TRINITY_DN1626_c0_g1~~TRINITY_DN1626_c0_g1_i3.p1  ORF type:complete len:131 (-),score=55.26 TRINITY_DN1626_c0_g1_i3:429-821(-)
MSDSEVEEGIGLEEGSFEDDEEKEQQAGGADDMDNDAQEEGDEEKDEEEDEEEEGEEENEEEAINLEIGNRIVQDEKTRFQLDLEFVECLAQPYYLHRTLSRFLPSCSPFRATYRQDSCLLMSHFVCVCV